MKATLVKKQANWYNLYQNDIGIGSTHAELQGHKLSLKNCQAVERGYDLDELAYSNVPNGTYETSYIDLGLDIYKEGFQKALELMGDKTFSEEDLRLAMHFGKFGEANNQTTTIGFIQSLQQTEWDVEVEMEKYGYCEGCRKAGIWHCAHADSCGNAIELERPKLDKNGWLILKRI